MSIGNKEIGTPTKKIPTPNRYLALLSQISWYFFGMFRYLEYGFLKIWINIDIFRQNKIGLVFCFCCCHFIGIGLVSLFRLVNFLKMIPISNLIIYIY